MNPRDSGSDDFGSGSTTHEKEGSIKWNDGTSFKAWAL